MSQTQSQEIPKEILSQLKQSRVNGFPFFAYTGIKEFVLLGEDTLYLKKVPGNPGHITGIQIKYIYDTYHISLFQKHQATIPHKEFDDIYADQMVDLIISEMKIR